MSDSSDQGVSLKLAAAFFETVNVSPHSLALFARHSQLRQKLMHFMGSYWDLIWWKESPSQCDAREEVGNFRFLHPAAVTEYMGFSFSDDNLVSLGQVPFSAKRLRCAKDLRMMLMADPGLSIMEMKALFPDEFLQQSHFGDWELVRKKADPSWVLIAVTPQGSNNLDFPAQDQKRQEHPEFRIPDARRQIFAMLAQNILHGSTFNGIIRTCDVMETKLGLRRVTVSYGAHGPIKISIDTWEDKISSDRIVLGLEMEPSKIKSDDDE